MNINDAWQEIKIFISGYMHSWVEPRDLIYNTADILILFLSIYLVICFIKVSYRRNNMFGHLTFILGSLLISSRIVDHLLDATGEWFHQEWIEISIRILTLIFVFALSIIQSKIFGGLIQLEKLANENLRMFWIVSSSKDAIISCDLEGKIVTWNPAAERLFGYSSSEIIDQSISIIMPAENKGIDYLEKKFAKLSANHKVKEECVKIHKLAHEVPVLYIGSRILNEKGEIIGYSFIYSDITEKKALEAQLRDNLNKLKIANTQLSRHKKKLEQANQNLRYSNGLLKTRNKELNEFTYIASHDLRAPLRAIANLSEWIVEDSYQALPKTSKEHLDLLRQRINRMERLLDDLLVYAQLGIKSYPTEVVSLNEMIHEVMNLAGTNGGVQYNIQENLPVLKTHRIPLQQVFQNLINNAIKHHPDPSTAVITIRALIEGSFVHISVQDNGTGIARRHFKKILKMFETLSPKDTIEGSGMGLAIVKKIVEQYGGALKIDSQMGSGTTFTFSWPMNIKNVG